MINSRKIDDLLPQVARLCQSHIDACKAEGIDLLVTSTLRDAASQWQLYSQGRKLESNGTWVVVDKSKIVTNAKPGQSWHNWRCAYDVVPLVNGKPVWGTTGDDLVLWNTVGKIGHVLGLEWAGNWTTFKEFPHFQLTLGYTLADFQEGKVDYSKFA